MPKKKVKGKGKKKSDKSKKKVKEENEEEKPKEPTEKEIFEMKIEELKQEMKEADDRLQQHEEALEHIQHLLDTEKESKLSCVAYLKRVLQAENSRRMDIQDKLQTERDLTELMEKRILGKLAVSERSSEAARSQFLQQKMELEGKLSLLEELRLERNSQRAHLKKVEDALEEKTSALREKSREEDMKQVHKLLKNRENFLKLCSDIKTEWQEAFKLRLPVHAKRQLEENVRLRDECDRNTKQLLQVQDQNRNVKDLQKSLELEEEIQSTVEDKAKKRRNCQERRLRRLRQFSQEIQSMTKANSSAGRTNDDTEETEEDVSNLEQASDKKKDDFHSEESAINHKISSIREYEIEECRLQDKLHELDAILRDQINYKNTLQSDIEANIDRNGAMISAVLRSGKIFQTRCGKLTQENLDYDVLHQIRILLDS